MTLFCLEVVDNIKKFYIMTKKLVFLFFPIVFLSGCFSSPAREVSNICHLLDEEVSWYRHAKATEKKYGAPSHIILAIMYQESRFDSDARPPREKLFGVIPWLRPSSAYGFAQAKDNTWDWYKLKSGNSDADRDDFDDAIDFVGWYISQSEKLSKIKKTDAYNQYLAFHEGHGGFNNGSFKQKTWLLDIAKKVDQNAKKYKKQLDQCRDQLDSNRVWRFF